MITRRSVLALGGGVLAASLLTEAQASDTPIRVGLAGADSEGIILAKDAMRADARVRLVAIADESAMAARRALMVFAHPLRRAGVHPQVEMDEEALFAGADSTQRMLDTVPLDAVLLVGPGRSVADGLAVAVAGRLDAYVKLLGLCDAGSSGAMLDTASEAAARGVIVGLDMPWRYEAAAVPAACRLNYPRSEGARARSFAAFLSARDEGFCGQAELAESLGLLTGPVA